MLWHIVQYITRRMPEWEFEVWAWIIVLGLFFLVTFINIEFIDRDSDW